MDGQPVKEGETSMNREVIAYAAIQSIGVEADGVP